MITYRCLEFKTSKQKHSENKNYTKLGKDTTEVMEALRLATIWILWSTETARYRTMAVLCIWDLHNLVQHSYFSIKSY